MQHASELRPPYWEHGVLATGPLGSSPSLMSSPAAGNSGAMRYHIPLYAKRMLTACLKGMRSLSSEFLICGATARLTTPGFIWSSMSSCRYYAWGSGKWNNDANAPATTFWLISFALLIARFISRALSFSSIVLCVCFMPPSHPLITVACNKCLNQRVWDLQLYSSFSRDCFGYSRPLKIPYEWIGSSASLKWHWDFDRYCIKSADCYE